MMRMKVFGREMPTRAPSSLVIGLVAIQTLFSGVAAKPRNVAFITTTTRSNIRSPSRSSRTSMSLSMGLFDFLNKRDGDFVELDKTDSAFGPGPLLLLYKVPPGVTDEEVYDMVSDGAPQAFEKGVVVSRIASDKDDLMDLSVTDALASVISDKAGSGQDVAKQPGCPVLFYSGFQNDEMLATYEIIGREIYEETGGMESPACAKAVPNAMDKPLRQVLEEISSDHMDAMSSLEE